jgi:hypothetical protein
MFELKETVVTTLLLALLCIMLLELLTIRLYLQNTFVKLLLVLF